VAIADCSGPPAPFVKKALQRLTKAGFPGRAAVDVGCGFGRHSVYLAEQNYVVTAIDIDRERITRLVAYLNDRPNLAASGYLVDAYSCPSSWYGQFDLCVVVDFVRADIVPIALGLLRPGGYLIYQSVGNRGENWTLLPQRQEMKRTAELTASITDYEERQAGPEDSGAVTVRFVAQKHDARLADERRIHARDTSHD
jgi:SAM-dependent methyltransferase